MSRGFSIVSIVSIVSMGLTFLLVLLAGTCSMAHAHEQPTEVALSTHQHEAATEVQELQPLAFSDYRVVYTTNLMGTSGATESTRQLILALANASVDVTIEAMSGAPEAVASLSNGDDMRALKEIVSPISSRILSLARSTDSDRNVYDVLQEERQRTKKTIQILDMAPDLYTTFKQRGQHHYYIGRCSALTENVSDKWARGLRLVDELWVPTKGQAKAFRALVPEKIKVTVVPESINPDAWPLQLPEWKTENNTLAITAGGFKYLAVLDLSSRKGINRLIRAFLSAFPNTDYGVGLILKINPSANVTTRQVEEHIYEHNRRLIASVLEPRLGAVLSTLLPQHVVVVEHQLVQEQMPDLYRQADVFVSPSNSEEHSRALMEAMIMEKPVLATRWWTAGTLFNQTTGYVIPHIMEEPSGPAQEENPFIKAYVGKPQSWAVPRETDLQNQLAILADPNRASSLRAHGFAARRSILCRHSREVIGRKARSLLDAIAETLPEEVQAHTHESGLPWMREVEEAPQPTWNIEW